MVTLEALALVVALAGAGDAVLLDFSAPWCQPCQQMEPTVRRLVREGYAVRQINVDEQADLAARYQITGVPCFIMLVDGQEVDRVEGTCSHARLMQMFAKVPTGARAGAIRAQSPDAPASGFDASASLAAPGNGVAPQNQSPQRLVAIESSPTHDRQTSSQNADPQEHALLASIRIRVEDAAGQSVGSGTIVDTHGREALGITCGHIFRDSQGRGKVLIDLFASGQLQTVEGALIDYDMERDIALVSFVPPTRIAPVRIAPAGYAFHRSDRVFSIGCDHGREPSIRDSRITSIDRYVGAPNIEAAGEPAEGRSGGGLFSSEGFLIGICNHADPADDEGIYASLPTIHWQLDRVGQRRVYQPQAATLAASDPGLRRLEGRPSQPAAAVEPGASNDSLTSIPAATRSAVGDTEVICILRSRSNPDSERVLVLDQPSRELLERLAQESRTGLARRDDAIERSGPIARTSAIPGRASGPVVRAQSGDRQ